MLGPLRIARMSLICGIASVDAKMLQIHLYITYSASIFIICISLPLQALLVPKLQPLWLIAYVSKIPGGTAFLW
jgi:hypothetical protein